MIIKTITCHDVYNVGASLQAYALQTFLENQGHDVRIINYKPKYLCGRYNFFSISNPKYNKNFITKILYITLKFPIRVMERPGKHRFDTFRKKYLKLTKRYNSLDELKIDPPKADLYIAGSDQIWNTLFENGRDGAFFLEFVTEKKKKISYAASFATTKIMDGYVDSIKKWLKEFNFLSIREKDSLALLDEMGINGCAVLDPVFLIEKNHWKKMIKKNRQKNSIFVYDFENSELVKKTCSYIKNESKYRIVSFFKSTYADEILKYPGPIEFITEIYNSKVVISNSFHGTVYALIFHKDFYVINREEDINVRMISLLNMLNLKDRIIRDINDINRSKPIQWNVVDEILLNAKIKSENYLKKAIDDSIKEV